MKQAKVKTMKMKINYWQAWCDCGWKGKERKSMSWARRDLKKHYFEMDDKGKDHWGEGNIQLTRSEWEPFKKALRVLRL